MNRNFYIVKVRYGDADTVENKEETEEVDMSVILKYVSQRELERFENAEFRAEAEAEAAMRSVEREELERHRLEKNARTPVWGRGGRMNGGLEGLSTQGIGRGRLRGRGKGRGRGRGRGGAGHALAGLENQKLENVEGVEGVEDELDAMDIEYVGGPYNDEALQRAIAETSSEDPDGMEEDDGQSTKTSPDFMRSAMIANSALPTSPIAMHRRLSIVHRGHPEVPDIEGSDDASISNAAARLMAERQTREHPGSDESEGDTQHHSKRPRTESTSSLKPSVSRKVTSATIVVAPKTHPFFAYSKQPQSQSPPAYIQDKFEDEVEESEDDIPSHTTTIPMGVVSEVEDEEEEEEEEEEAGPSEYVVERILDHSLREGVKYYRVKWAGYEDATDWLEEQDLENVQELVQEYNEKLKGKAAVR